MLEQADDMAIDIPHIWLYLAELLSPVLKEGGFSMRELFRYETPSHAPGAHMGEIKWKSVSRKEPLIGSWRPNYSNWSFQSSVSDIRRITTWKGHKRVDSDELCSKLSSVWSKDMFRLLRFILISVSCSVCSQWIKQTFASCGKSWDLNLWNTAHTMQTNGKKHFS